MDEFLTSALTLTGQHQTLFEISLWWQHIDLESSIRNCWAVTGSFTCRDDLAIFLRAFTSCHFFTAFLTRLSHSCTSGPLIVMCISDSNISPFRELLSLVFSHLTADAPRSGQALLTGRDMHTSARQRSSGTK